MAEGSGLWLQYSGSCALVQEVNRSTKKRGRAVGSICAIANRAALPLTCSNNRGPPCEAVGSICAIANRAVLPLTCSNNSDIGADNNLGLTTVLGAVDLNFEIVAIPACPLEAGKSKSVE